MIDNNDATAAIESPGFSIDAAADMIVDAKVAAEPARAQDGKFAPKADDTAKVVDLKTGKPAEAVKAEAAPAEAADDDDPEFELPAEKDGEAPKRLKFSQIYEGYEKAAKLEAELTSEREKGKTVPAEYRAGLHETVQARQKYIEGLGMLSKMLVPRQPSLEMLDPNHPKYDPDGYYAAARKFEHDSQTLQAINADRDKQARAQEEQTAVLRKAQLAETMSVLKQQWPEFVKDQAVRTNVIKAMTEDYGFSHDDVSSITDHRTLMVIRDALELRALKAKQAEAVKVVRAKPKLVKGAARSTTGGPSQARMNALGRFNESFSIEDAIDALVNK